MAGIAATALIGIVGSTTTWVVARDDRDTQVALARDERIYDRRSTAYVDVLMAMQSLSDDLRLLRFEKVPVWLDFQRSQATLRARMTAFASGDALRLYNQMFVTATRALSAVEGLRRTERYGDRYARSELWRTDISIRAFEVARRQFQFVSAGEVGGASH